MLTLYDFMGSGNGYKVRLLLTQLGTPFERVEYDIDRGATRTPDFLRLNPNGRVPVLQFEDGRILAESDAILVYLAEGTPYLPLDRFERALVLQWLFFEQYSHEPNVATPRFILRHLGADHPRRAELPQRQARGHEALAVMEQHLRGRSWFVEERFSLADIALYAYTHVAEEGGLELARYPQLRAWIGKVAAQPRYVRLLERPAGAAVTG